MSSKENHADMIVNPDHTLKMGFGSRLQYDALKAEIETLRGELGDDVVPENSGRR